MAHARRIGDNPRVAELEDVWIPLVDEPIGSIVAAIQAEDTEIDRLVNTPHKILAFRTFAYVRVGVLLGQLLVEHDVPAYDGSETWIEALLREPRHHEAVAHELRSVAEEIAADPRFTDPQLADPKFADTGPIGPDAAAKERFLEFARNQLG